MAAYRLYFRARGLIVARQDFTAEDDRSAQRIAAALFNACSDRSDLIELWEGTRQIPVDLPGRSVGFDALSAAHQEVVVKTEETIVRSEWAIAASRQLLQQLDRAKGSKLG